MQFYDFPTHATYCIDRHTFCCRRICVVHFTFRLVADRTSLRALRAVTMVDGLPRAPTSGHGAKHSFLGTVPGVLVWRNPVVDPDVVRSTPFSDRY